MTRPTTVILFGVGDLIFGILTACLDAANVSTAMVAVEAAQFRGELPEFPPFMTGDVFGDGGADPLALGVFMCRIALAVVLIVAGLGLLKRRPWGLRAGIGISLLLLLYFVVVDVALQLEAVGRALAAIDGAGVGTSEMFMTYKIVLALVAFVAPFHLAFPALQLFCLTRPDVKKVFMAEPAA